MVFMGPIVPTNVDIAVMVIPVINIQDSVFLGVKLALWISYVCRKVSFEAKYNSKSEIHLQN